MFISSRSRRWHFGWSIAAALGLALCWAVPMAAEMTAQQPFDLSASDHAELPRILRSQFPEALLAVFPLSDSVILEGRAESAQINQIVAIAEDFYPKVHNHIVAPVAPSVSPAKPASQAAEESSRRLPKH
ncbi:MAG TPA: hypothetical protein VHY20_03170 [Pirellulales bacterium]|jgi:hypothetical protein|nr:hypothetical protein [Pirellulales bacterium]